MTWIMPGRIHVQFVLMTETRLGSCQVGIHDVYQGNLGTNREAIEISPG